MPAASLNKYNEFTLDLGSGIHDFTTHTLKIALTNTLPVATHTTLSQVGEIAAGNGYTAGGNTLSTVTFTQTGGVATLDAANSTFTASGGSIGPFRYVVLYNDTPTTPKADPVIGYYDYGSAITLADTETFEFQVTTEIFDVT